MMSVNGDYLFLGKLKAGSDETETWYIVIGLIVQGKIGNDHSENNEMV